MKLSKLESAESGARPTQVIRSTCGFLIDACSGQLLVPVRKDAEYEVIGSIQEHCPSIAPEDEWLTAEQAAPLLNVEAQYLYRHWRKLPFAKKFSPKCLRFSRRGILEHGEATR
jgi:hypothetical protein